MYTMTTIVQLLVYLLVIACITTCTANEPNYYIGVGRADITGPAAEVNMMGYANPSQSSSGIHFRLYSRAFVIADQKNDTRIVFVSADVAMISQLVKLEVIKKLQAQYGTVYNEQNVCLSSIHTHSGPGGFLQYVLYEITSLGFVRESLDAIVDGIVKSIYIASQNLQPGNIYLNHGELLDSNINRSPTAYLNNPEQERSRYKYDVDKDMIVLKMVNLNGDGIGMISWFAVHCTSMNNTNELISGDNKGYASLLFENHMNTGSLPGTGDFVAAFAQTNEGDVSPNTKGPHCQDSGNVCDLETSTCDGKSELCVASGPGVDMTDSTRIIGLQQYTKALELYDNAAIQLTGPVDYRHQNVDMTEVEVNLQDGTKVNTCKPAMGYSFAAGTTDGPGAFDFQQGTTSGNFFWNLVRNFISKPSQKQIDCHSPKPILLNTGEMTFPYAWQPAIVETQLLRVGGFYAAAVPGEFTTMSGRRIRENVIKTLSKHGITPDMTVIAGLSNTYSSYIATYEEYQVQRYEGASTVYGPHTLQAYVQIYNELTEAIATGNTTIKGPSPPNLLDDQLSFLPPVIYDGTPFGKSFGDVLENVNPKYYINDTVKVVFVAGNPRNDLKTGATFLAVERWDPTSSSWITEFTDASWETRFSWERTSTIFGHSKATVEWTIPPSVNPGVFRISHFGNERSISGKIDAYSGRSDTFVVGDEDELTNGTKERIEAWDLARAASKSISRVIAMTKQKQAELQKRVNRLTLKRKIHRLQNLLRK